MLDNTKTLTPIPGPAYRLLDAFIGTWLTTGNLKVDEGDSDLRITGTDTYEWLPGGFFILHKVNVVIGEDRKESIEVIGFDAASNSYPMHSYDNHGEMSTLYASEHHGIWTFMGDNIRFTGAFSEDCNTISGIWEQYTSGSWEFLMDIKLEREC